MKAVNYYLVVDKIKEKPKKEKGFFISEAQKSDIRYLKGKVISAGDEVKEIKQDDIVWYDKHAGHSIEWKDKVYYVIKIGDIVIVE
jgi:co-chaperonin GroES (HSP10)